MNNLSAHSNLPVSRSYRSLVLSMLVVVYTFNFIDRQIIGILAEPIRLHFDLNDTQMGWLLGPSFAILYTTLAIPIAWLADRKNRVWIMTIALTVWSAMTALCGYANNFTQLFLARIGVGVGEAGGVAPAYSLIADYYPAEKRGRALAIFSFGIPIGSAVGIIMGGVIATVYDWRLAFIVIGVLGVLIAPLFKLLVKEPKRGQFDPPGTKIEAESFNTVLSTVTGKKSFWFMAFGAASASMLGYGLFGWMASFLVRSYPEALPQFFGGLPAWLLPPEPSPLLFAAYFYGAVILIAGCIGMWAGGYLSDRFGSMTKKAYVMVPAIAFAIILPFYIISMVSTNLSIVFFALMIPTGLGLIWLGPLLAAIQGIVTPNMRASASAMFLFIVNLIGIALGPLLIGMLSESLKQSYGDESLRYSILAGSVFYIIAAILLFIASRYIENDWEN